VTGCGPFQSIFININMYMRSHYQPCAGASYEMVVRHAVNSARILDEILPYGFQWIEVDVRWGHSTESSESKSEPKSEPIESELEPVIGHDTFDRGTGSLVLEAAESLRNFLARIPNRLNIILDLKDPRPSSKLASTVSKVVHNAGMADRCVFASFNEYHLEDLLAVEKSTGRVHKKALITNSIVLDMFSEADKHFRLDYVIMHIDAISRETVNRIQEIGPRVLVFTCNHAGERVRVSDCGAYGIISDLTDYGQPARPGK